MCGIGGILRVHPPGSEVPPPELSIPEAWLDILDDSIKHRGPDGQGRFRDRAIRPDGSVVDVALVHRRLSILDHAGGAQPMVSLGRSAPLRTSVPGTSALRADPTHPSFSSTSTSNSPASSDPTTTAHGSSSAGSKSRPTYRGLPLPVLFHGQPKDEVRYRTMVERGNGNGSGDLVLAHEAHGDLVAVVFNGCIYNHRELRKELQTAGHEFVTDHSDTEVLVHGWREWGTGLWVTHRLDGMFAAAVWDARQGDLYLLRDRFGEKPLYSSRQSDASSLVFASTAAAIARVSKQLSTKFELDHSGIGDWLHYGHDEHESPLEVVKPIPFGSLVTVPEHVQEGSRFRLRFPPLAPRKLSSVPHSADPLPADARVERALTRSIERQVDSDVPLACFLSGGVDSSLICALAARRRPDLAAITVRMPHAEYDETPFAKQAARVVGVRHVIVDADTDPAADLTRLITCLGLPFGDSSILPTYWAAKVARRDFGVVLTGDGADELFLGYERYLAADWFGWKRHFVRLLPTSLISKRDPKSRWTKVARLIGAIRKGGYSDLAAIFPAQDWLAVVRQSTINVTTFFYDDVSDPLSARNEELEHSLPGDMLRKVDTAAMSVSLETRAPFLDNEVADTVFGLTLSDLMPRGQRKGLLRAVAHKYFPSEIVDRPKQGFAIPIGEWFRSDYGQMRQLLLDHLLGPEPFGPDSLGINAMINMNFVRQMLKEHDDAGVKSLWPWKGRDHSQRLYMLLVLSIWGKWLGKL